MCNKKAAFAMLPAVRISPRTLLCVVLALFLCRGGPRLIAAEACSWPRFHGAKGDNISTETGLLRKWPDQGPKLLWTAKGIGAGFTGVTIADGRIYTSGDVGRDLVLFALDMEGRILWQTKNGPAWTESGGRSGAWTWPPSSRARRTGSAAPSRSWSTATA